MSLRVVLLATALAACAVLASIAAQAAAVFEVQVAPPPPQVEAPGLRPGWVWKSGYWRWTGKKYVWVDGHWVQERKGWHWVPEHWVSVSNGHWRFVPGRWDRH